MQLEIKTLTPDDKKIFETINRENFIKHIINGGSV